MSRRMVRHALVLAACAASTMLLMPEVALAASSAGCNRDGFSVLGVSGKQKTTVAASRIGNYFDNPNVRDRLGENIPCSGILPDGTLVACKGATTDGTVTVTANCTAQNQVQGRAVVVEFPFPAVRSTL